MSEWTSKDIAEQREIEASKLSEMTIYRSIVENIVSLECSTKEKVDILVDAVPDFGILIVNLSQCQSKGLVNYNDYASLSKGCLLKANRDRAESISGPFFLNTKREGM